MKKFISSLLFVFAILFMSNTVEASVVSSGSIPCSQGAVSWTVDDSGSLTISGQGTVSLGNEYTSMGNYWYKQGILENNITEIHIESPITHGIKFVNNEAESLFLSLDSVTDIYGIDYLDFTEATSIAYAFSMKSLENIHTGKKGSSSDKVNNFTISSNNLTNIESLFKKCESLNDSMTITIPASVKNMDSIFKWCSNIKNITMKSQSTNTLTNIDDMFNSCEKLQTVTFDGVIDMSQSVVDNYQYRYCYSLVSIDVRNVNSKIYLPAYAKYSDSQYGSYNNVYWVDSVDKNVHRYNTLVSGSKVYNLSIPIVKYVFHDFDNGETGEFSIYQSSDIVGINMLLASPEKKGYSFVGYYLDENFTTQSNVFDFSDSGHGVIQKIGLDYTYEDYFINGVELYTKWNPVKYSISYTLNGGENHKDNPSTYTIEEDNITLQNPTKEGYAFKGWYTSSNFQANTLVTNINTTDVKNINVYAKWECLHTTTTLKNYVAPTCCEDGYSGDEYCVECSEQVGIGENTPATQMHTTTITGKVDPTCVTEGHTGKTYCANSGLLLDAGTIIQATGIHDIEIRNAKEPTCAVEGYTGDKYCKVCEQLIEQGSVIPATEQHTTVLKDNKVATCKEEGYTGDAYCTVCEQLLTKGEIIPITEHNYDNGVVIVEPTETTTGIRIFTCEDCQETKTEELPVVVKECKHEKTEIKNAKAPTCKVKGYSGDTYCCDCKALLSEGTFISVTDNHEWTILSVKPATTTEDGEKTYCCLVCETEKKEIIPKIETTKPDTPTDTPSEEKKPDVPTDTPSEEKKPDNPTENDSIKKAQKTKATITKATNTKGKKITIKLKQIKGYKYQIKVCTSKKFKKSVKTYTTSKTSYTVKKLKKGKKYYVKVRTYKKINGNTYYGKWSKVKSVKIKK